MKAAFQATYSDWKLIRTRKVVQIVLEIPVEQLDAAYSVLGGMPNTAAETWVAVARLNESATEASPAAAPTVAPRGAADNGAAPRTPRPFNLLPLSQQAALLSNDPVFAAFAREQLGTNNDPADVIREHCGVTSRGDLRFDNDAGRKFIALRQKYLAWKIRWRP